MYSVTLRGQTAALRPSHHPHHHRTGFCAPRLSKGSSRLIINRPWILSSVAFANSHCALPYGPADAHCTLLFNAEFRFACPAAFERFRSSVLEILDTYKFPLPRFLSIAATSFAFWAFVGCARQEEFSTNWRFLRWSSRCASLNSFLHV